MHDGDCNIRVAERCPSAQYVPRSPTDPHGTPSVRPSVRPSVCPRGNRAAAAARRPCHVAVREVHVVRQPPRAQLETLFQSEELTLLQFLQARSSMLHLGTDFEDLSCPSTAF